jgi:hypothetical protein
MQNGANAKPSKYLATIAICIFSLFHIDQLWAQNTLAITGLPPELPIEVGGSSWFIFLDGAIDSEAPTRFEHYVKKNNIPDRSIVYLNSPGGSLVAGIELGRLFREYGLSTNIGRKSPTSTKRFDVEVGSCYSACAYAYLGGQFRYYKTGSRYGVHQFKSRGPVSVDEGSVQIASAAIVEYLRSMDIDTDLFGLSASAGPAGMNEIDKPTLERLNVVNNGRTRPVWTIESNDGHLYLKGQRITEESGTNKFIVYCDGQQLKLLAIFDALRRETELMNMTAHSLLIDGEPHPVKAMSKRIQNGSFNVVLGLSRQEILALRKAESVGVAVQFLHGAPIFFGYDGMRIADGREKLAGIVNQCK